MLPPEPWAMRRAEIALEVTYGGAQVEPDDLVERVDVCRRRPATTARSASRRPRGRARTAGRATRPRRARAATCRPCGQTVAVESASSPRGVGGWRRRAAHLVARQAGEQPLALAGSSRWPRRPCACPSAVSATSTLRRSSGSGVRAPARRVRAGRGSGSCRRSTARTISLSSVGDMRCGRPDELEHAEHRVVDEQQPERVEAAVLERVDQQADARQTREQPDRARAPTGTAPRSRSVTARDRARDRAAVHDAPLVVVGDRVVLHRRGCPRTRSIPAPSGTGTGTRASARGRTGTAAAPRSRGR